MFGALPKDFRNLGNRQKFSGDYFLEKVFANLFLDFFAGGYSAMQKKLIQEKTYPATEGKIINYWISFKTYPAKNLSSRAWGEKNNYSSDDFFHEKLIREHGNQ